ncbi:beta-galactosidase [Georgenia muralis]
MTGNPLRQGDRAITVADHEFRVDGEKVSLYGGAVHYWRLDRDKWDGILQSVKDLGFNMISIYIPWEAHEIERGVFDFGQQDPRTDIDAFLTLCEEKGFKIVVRPGPQINSEMTWFGYPKRILADQDLHALSAQGSKSVLTQVPKPIPALSYTTEKFFDETALWFDAICEILARHAHPKGGIIAAQVDNEMAFFFGINAYSGDFSASSLAAYREFLRGKYGSLDEINAVHGTQYGTEAEIDPPRRFEATDRTGIARQVDWVEYRERYLVDSMDRLATMMRERGLDQIALFHNYPHPLGPGGAASGFTTPFNIPALEEKLDYVGFDIYSRKHLYDHVKTVASYVVGTSRYPYIPEFIAGVWPWYLRPGEAYDEEFVTKAALMHGIKGFSRYMLVERDRWLDSPIRRDGRVRDKAQMFAQANAMQVDGGFGALRRESDVLLLANREYDRLEAASVLVSFPGDFLETPSGFSEYPNRMTVAEDTLGFDQPVQVAKGEWFLSFYKALYDSGYGFLLSDTALEPGRWARYRAVVVGTFDYLNATTQQALVDYASAGGTLVIGPKIPELDSSMRECRILADALGDSSAAESSGQVFGVGDGRIVLIPDLATVPEVLGTVLEESTASRVRKSDERLDVVVHRDDQQPSRRVVFVCNPTAEAIQARIGVGVTVTGAQDLWGGGQLTTQDGELTLDLPPYTIEIADCTVQA